ncbi:CHAD domain-containing protein [Rhodobacter sp. 140A]|uniref:CHAD domain-containing protein n=1 Tax=bioreactor metagenome TaxID=1076179 RepID=A0A644UZY6_9ZZZZ|nr:CHAD domain-containing protein [Rhodobacter sp. 140A]
MPFQFDPKEPRIAKTVRHIARDELRGALDKLATSPGEGSLLHGLRKHIKKTRGLLRLVAPVFPEFHRENAVLRDAAAAISELRDAEVMRLSLTRLGAAEDAAGVAARQMLAAVAPAPATPPAAALAAFGARIAEVHDRAAHWAFEKKGWDALAPGLAATFHDARRRMTRAARDGDDEHFHAWRSRVKHHWYQARLLLPIWPEMMAAHADIADRLGEALGQHHDLAVLARAMPDHLSPEAAVALSTRIEDEKKRLETLSFFLGERLFAEKPEALVARWGAWYALWRQEDHACDPALPEVEEAED